MTIARTVHTGYSAIGYSAKSVIMQICCPIFLVPFVNLLILLLDIGPITYSVNFLVVPPGLQHYNRYVLYLESSNGDQCTLITLYIVTISYHDDSPLSNIVMLHDRHCINMHYPFRGFRIGCGLDYSGPRNREQG